MTSANRKGRGYATQVLAAEWFRHRGFPYCTDTGPGRQGRDLLNLTGLAAEIKARKDFEPLAWIKQATSNAGHDLPFVLLRCNGQGPAAIAEWPVLLRLGDFTDLIRAAGYGDPEEEEEAS